MIEYECDNVHGGGAGEGPRSTRVKLKSGYSTRILKYYISSIHVHVYINYRVLYK